VAQRGKDKEKDKAAEEEKDPKSVVETDENLYKCGKAKGRFRINFKPDVELNELVDWAMGFSCKSFIYASGIGGRSAKVTMKTPKDLSARQAWALFLSALRAMNLTVVPAGSVLEIVEQPQAKRKALPVYNKGRPANNAQVVRAVIRPRHLPVGDLATVLTELKSKDGEVKAVDKAGIIVVTDFGSHIAKMTTLMATVDKPVAGGERLYMIKVKHAEASELAAKLQEILGVKESPAAAAPSARSNRRNRRNRDDAKKAAKPASSPSRDAVEAALPSKIIADERSNSLILLATEPAYLRVKALVKRLDIGTDVEGGGRIHVYLLENADSEEMANTLTTVISGIQQPSGQQGGGANRR
jgi:general secretion pathway protein D